jgi:hypothetical protein
MRIRAEGEVYSWVILILRYETNIGIIHPPPGPLPKVREGEIMESNSRYYPQKMANSLPKRCIFDGTANLQYPNEGL